MTVSVILAAFNVEGCIERALRSAVEQSSPPLEIIVVDDCSTDNTCGVVLRAAETWPNVKLLRQPVNNGPSEARNAAIKAALGEWVAILDADDAWRPNRLEMLESLGEQEKADFVADNIILYDNVAQKETRPGFKASWKFKALTTRELLESDIDFIKTFSWLGVKPLIRRSFLQDHGIYYDDSLRYGEDADLYLRLSLAGCSMIVSSEPGYIYTARQGEISRKINASSKTSPRFDSVVRQNQLIIDRFGDRMDAATLDAAVRRGRSLSVLHRDNLARDRRRSGRWDRYLWMVATDPELSMKIIKRGLRRLAGKGSNATPVAAD